MRGTILTEKDSEEQEMAYEILPVIAEDDYEDFLRIIARYFPDAYDGWPPNYPEWRQVHREEANRVYHKGDKVREVPVTPDEFQEYCQDRDLKDISMDLWRCAREKDARHGHSGALVVDFRPSGPSASRHLQSPGTLLLRSSSGPPGPPATTPSPPPLPSAPRAPGRTRTSGRPRHLP